MAARVQRLPVLQLVGAERPAAVGRVALCGGRHGELVRKVWVWSPLHPWPNISSCCLSEFTLAPKGRVFSQDPD